MKNISVCKITSCLSVILSIVFFYELTVAFSSIKELISDISLTAFIVTVFVILNFSVSILFLTKKLNPKLILIAFQIIIIIITNWALYEIYSFNGVTVIHSQTVS